MDNESNYSKISNSVFGKFLAMSSQLDSVQPQTAEEWETRQEPIITPFEVTDKLTWPALTSRMTNIDQWILDVDQIMYMNPMSHKTNIEASLQMDRIMEEMKGLAKELGLTFVLEGKIFYADLEGTGLRETFEPLSWQEDSKAVAMINELKGKHRQPGCEFDFPVHLKYEGTGFGEVLVGDPEQIDPRKPTQKVAILGGGKRSMNLVDALLATEMHIALPMPVPSPRPLEKESWKQTKIHRGKGHNKLKRRK